MNRNSVTTISILLIASAICCGLVLARIVYTGRIAYLFLVWNLFLAWIPLWVALAIRHTRPALLPFLLMGGLWLLFFPNAPYIVTDFVHLRYLGQNLWLELVMILSFALTGLFVGFTSLGWMQTEVRTRWGALTSWVFVLGSLALSGFGVYIGRFLRWNSWEIFTRPHDLLADVFNQFATPYELFHTSSITLLFTLIFIFSYIMTIGAHQRD